MDVPQITKSSYQLVKVRPQSPSPEPAFSQLENIKDLQRSNKNESSTKSQYQCPQEHTEFKNSIYIS